MEENKGLLLAACLMAHYGHLLGDKISLSFSGLHTLAYSFMKV